MSNTVIFNSLLQVNYQVNYNVNVWEFKECNLEEVKNAVDIYSSCKKKKNYKSYSGK
jgi:hypothetical protein